LKLMAYLETSFLYGFPDHILHPVREKTPFLGPLLKKKRELGGTRFINKACILYKRLLGTSGMVQVQSKVKTET
jgi:hypothetical protein